MNSILKLFGHLCAIVTKTLFSAIVVVSAYSAQSYAGWLGESTIDRPFPTKIEDFAGVFSGKLYSNRSSQKVEVFVLPGPMSGSFRVALLMNYGRKLQIFYAEALDQRTLGLIAQRLAGDRTALENKMPPAALLKVAVDEGNVMQSIEISPLGDGDVLPGVVKLSSVSRIYANSSTLAQGEYKQLYFGSEFSSVQVTKSGSGSDDTRLTCKIEPLDIFNDFSFNFELTGIGALRSSDYNNQFQKHVSLEVSALVIPIIAYGRPAMIVAKEDESGSSANSVILRIK